MSRKNNTVILLLRWQVHLVKRMYKFPREEKRYPRNYLQPYVSEHKLEMPLTSVGLFWIRLALNMILCFLNGTSGLLFVEDRYGSAIFISYRWCWKSCGGCVYRGMVMLVSSYPNRFNAFHPDTRKPMHRECGFIRIKPDTNKVAFISAQNTGTSLITLAGFPLFLL